MIATRFGKCPACRKPIVPGTHSIEKDRRGWVHSDCALGGNPYPGALPTSVLLRNDDQVLCRSITEAEWVLAIDDSCHNLWWCHECETLRLVRKEPSDSLTYRPDIKIETGDGFPRQAVYLEFKSDEEDALNDDRQERALWLNPDVRFVVIGGRPHWAEGFLVRLVASNGQQVYENVRLPDLAELLGCEGNGED